MNWSEGIKAFKSYLILEKGLSENTLENYIFDVQKLIAYLDKHNIKFGPTKVDSDQLLQLSLIHI